MARNVWDASLRAIEKVEKGMPVQEAMAILANSGNLSRQDLRLCGDLVNGYFRTCARIARILERVLRKPGNLPPKMRAAVGLGIYSLIFQRTPAYAVLDNVVKLVKRKFGPKLAGVANGALRSTLDLGDKILDPLWYKNASEDIFKAYSVFYSIPSEIALLWKDSYGENAAFALMRRSSERPWRGLRINRTSPAGHILENLFENDFCGQFWRVGWAGLVFAPGSLPECIGGLTMPEWHAKGAFSYQSPASMLVLEKLNLGEWNGPAWDMCAGYGGKTAALLECGIDVRLSADTDIKRLSGLPGDLRRLGLPAVNIVRANGLNPPLRQWNGNILLDVPCSGLGVLARRSDIRIRGNSERREQLPGMQLNLLKSAADILGKGGEIAYVTCTLNPAENGGVIDAFLADRPDFHKKTEWQTPHEHPWLEGMYGAVMVKTGNAD